MSQGDKKEKAAESPSSHPAPSERHGKYMVLGALQLIIQALESLMLGLSILMTVNLIILLFILPYKFLNMVYSWNKNFAIVICILLFVIYFMLFNYMKKIPNDSGYSSIEIGFKDKYIHKIIYISVIIGMIMMSLYCSSFIAIFMKDNGWCSFVTVRNEGKINVDLLSEDLLWHFLDSVPGLDLQKVYDWKDPISQSQSFLGGLPVLLFKFGVVVPILPLIKRLFSPPTQPAPAPGQAQG